MIKPKTAEITYVVDAFIDKQWTAIISTRNKEEADWWMEELGEQGRLTELKPKRKKR